MDNTIVIEYAENAEERLGKITAELTRQGIRFDVAEVISGYIIILKGY
jgi:hypothetical protein